VPSTVQNDRRRYRRTRKSPGKKSKVGIVIGVILLILLGTFFITLELSRPHVEGDRIRLDNIMNDISEGKIKNAKMLDVDGFIVGTYERPDGKIARYNAPYLKNQVGFFTDALLSNQIPTTVDQQNAKRIALLATNALPFLIFLMVIVYVWLSYRRGTGLFGIRSGARKIHADESQVTFSDVAGQETAITEVREVVDFLRDPERFAAIGATAPKGVLLYGPPGCGKTLMAKALAGESGASFFSISGSDFVEVYVGVGASRVRDLFAEARKAAPAIIFIDELDSVGRQRGGLNSHGEQEQALNQILTEMDGFSPTEGIVVVGATNRPDILDPALLRPGRFDRSIGLERPTEDARLSILKVHALSKQLDPTVDLGEVARRAVGMSGADLASVVNDAALLAARAHKPAITQDELDQAIIRMLEAPERQRRMSLRDRGIGKRVNDGTDERVTFADVAGQAGPVSELREIEQYLTDPERFQELGAEVPKGVLLYGPPGCGKTLLARALAGEANAAFFWVSASEFVEKLVGEGASRVRDLFAEARSQPPAIIFIDEIDAIGSRRTSAYGAGGAERDQTLNQLLTEMDGFSGAKGVIVLAATNRPDSLDPALLRPGRFDRTIGMERPDETGRLAILQVHLKEKPLAPGTDLLAIANRAIGLNGADLSNVMNEAALLAARDGLAVIGQAQLETALDRILEAPDRQRRLSMRDRGFGRRFTGAEDRVTFADVAGLDEAITELAEIKDYLAHPERFAELGARTPKGILLVGPPGCGKTLLARAVAGEANAAFFSVAATEFVEVFVGEGAARVRDLFAEAKSLAPAIVFIDELDAIGAHRMAYNTSGGAERENTLNQILVELDGFDPRSGVILMAATNRPDMLDSALVRPGRIDRRVTIEPPDRKGRRAILNLYATNTQLADDVDLDALAGLSQGFSGADLANLLNEAGLLAARREMAKVTNEIIEEALDRTVHGIGRTHVMSDEERRFVAYHESGHALVARALPGGDPPHKISIVPRGATLGAVTTLDPLQSDRVVFTRSRLLNSIATSFGGRVAEELVFGEPGAGASADLAKARSLARRMVCELGMGAAAGPLPFGADGRRDDGLWIGPVERSDELARTIDTEVQTVMLEAYQKARTVLLASRAALDRVAGALLERETLTAAELDDLAGPAVEPVPLTKVPARRRRAAAAGSARTE
jgi:cell division protease FtsH